MPKCSSEKQRPRVSTAEAALTPQLVDGSSKEDPSEHVPCHSQPQTAECKKDDFPKKYVIVSFVRHAEARSNVPDNHYSMQTDNEPLTPRGEIQAKALGLRWLDIRIDYLLSSPLTRAVQTAEAIAYINQSNPEIMQMDILKEQDHGKLFRSYMAAGKINAANTLRRGCASSDFDGVVPRNYRAPEGGESYNDLVARGARLLKCLAKMGVELTVPPRELSEEYTSTSLPDELPKTVPHIVVVSHNLFLSELYDALHCWGKPEHVGKMFDYQNANWTRHILELETLTEEPLREGEGSYANQYGIKLGIKTLKGLG